MAFGASAEVSSSQLCRCLMSPNLIEIASGEFSMAGDLASAVEAARTSGEAWASAWGREALRSESQAAQAIQARRQGRDLGFLLLRSPGALWEITLVFVMPEARGTGVFEALIEATKRTASIDNAAPHGTFRSDRLGLEVRADNLGALKAYERVGFKRVSLRRSYYRDGCDAILLEAHL